MRFRSPGGGDLRVWARDLVQSLNRSLPQLYDRRTDAAATEDGVLLWDRANLAPTVSRSGEYVLLAYRVDPPSSASDTGTAGDWASDADYFYVCTATDTWKRVAIATW